MSSLVDRIAKSIEGIGSGWPVEVAANPADWQKLIDLQADNQRLRGALKELARCPRCDSPDPRKHPAMQFEGEVQVCSHPWHLEASNESG